jgi:hypothetical protein
MMTPNTPFGPKFTCTRPPHMAFSAQIITLETGQHQLSLDFGAIVNQRPDWTHKQSIRLRKGEIAMLCAVCCNKLHSCGFGFRASKLGVQAKRNDDKVWLGCYMDRDLQKFIELTLAERYELYDLCLQVLSLNGQTPSEVLAQLTGFFE